MTRPARIIMLIDQLGSVTMNDYPPIKTFICSNFSDKHQKMMTWLRHLKREPTPRSRNPLRLPNGHDRKYESSISRIWSGGCALTTLETQKNESKQDSFGIRFLRIRWGGHNFCDNCSDTPGKDAMLDYSKPSVSGLLHKDASFFRNFSIGG